MKPKTKLKMKIAFWRGRVKQDPSILSKAEEQIKILEKEIKNCG